MPKKKKVVGKNSSKRKPVKTPVKKKVSKKVFRVNKFSISERAKKISQQPQATRQMPEPAKQTPLSRARPMPTKQLPPQSATQRVPSQEKISSGIPGFDIMTNGGFEKNSINLVAGGSGSGKSIFALQYLLEGVRNGEKVLYITFEEKKEDFYGYMKDFAWDLKKAEQSGRFFFLEYSPEKVKQMLDEGGGTIESMVLKHKITRIVFDSLTSFSLMFDDELSKRKSILGLFDILRKWDCTTLLTSQSDPSDVSNKGVSTSEFEADSITLLYFVKTGNVRRRFVEVLKMRGEDHSKDLHQFIIKRGIQVGSAAPRS